ncbi:MAG: exopolysaccharide biosynthesis glycosyltransferase EpsD [Myxococcaceae bacterium]
MNPLQLSVVIATYNRRALLERLLLQLAEQTLSKEHFEVVVVDDGSKVPVSDTLASLRLPYALRVETQENLGAAAARHRGALAARGEILVITDDDMQVPPEWLAEHLRQHQDRRRVVLGKIRPDPQLKAMPLFERWYAYRLAKMATAMESGTLVPRGGHFFTGNVSLRRADYVGVGGFNPTLKRSEDLELGLKLEKSGAQVVFAPSAYTLHGSDHTDFETWRRRAFLYGVFDSKIRDLHPDLPQADPWRFVFRLPFPARPLLFGAATFPTLSRAISWTLCACVVVADAVGAEKLAFAGASVVYQMEYYRGVRSEAGSLRKALADFQRYARNRVLPSTGGPA